jgi:hypothetical protein
LLRRQRPPCAFRFPSEAHRSTPAPSRDPEGSLDRRCFLPWAFVPHDTCRNGGPVARRASSPTACHVRGLSTSFAASTTIPARALRPPSVHGLHTSRRSPRAGRTPSRKSLPSCRSPRRFASPLKERADATGFRALIPTRARAVRRALASATRRCLLAILPFRAFSPSVLASASWFRARSPITRWAG